MTDDINKDHLSNVADEDLEALLFGDHEQLAREFVSLIFNRLVNSFAETTQWQIEALSGMKEANVKDSEVAKELSAAQERLKKILSEEVMQKVMDKMVALLKESLSRRELAYAIYQERITIKISGIAAQLDAAFKEAAGED